MGPNIPQKLLYFSVTLCPLRKATVDELFKLSFEIGGYVPDSNTQLLRQRTCEFLPTSDSCERMNDLETFMPSRGISVELTVPRELHSDLLIT